MISLAQATVNL